MTKAKDSDENIEHTFQRKHMGIVHVHVLSPPVQSLHLLFLLSTFVLKL